MTGNLRTTARTLLITFAIFITIPIITIVLHETDIITSGILADKEHQEFLVLSVMEILTLCCIPLSMKLMKIRNIRKSIMANPPRNFMKWGIIRLFLIGVPLIINTIFYYSYMNVAFGYMGIIGMLCMFFIYPSKERCANENGENQ